MSLVVNAECSDDVPTGPDENAVAVNACGPAVNVVFTDVNADGPEVNIEGPDIKCAGPEVKAAGSGVKGGPNGDAIVVGTVSFSQKGVSVVKGDFPC